MLGKTRREEIRALLDDYVRRIRHYAEIEIGELRDGVARRAAQTEDRRRARRSSCSTPPESSSRPSNSLAGSGDLRDRGMRELVFLCGDAEGFPAEIRAGAKQKISLSTLTMPHEFARVVLAEQIYRAFAILAGHPYPK